MREAVPGTSTLREEGAGLLWPTLPQGRRLYPFFILFMISNETLKRDFSSYFDVLLDKTLNLAIRQPVLQMQRAVWRGGLPSPAQELVPQVFLLLVLRQENGSKVSFPGLKKFRFPLLTELETLWNSRSTQVIFPGQNSTSLTWSRRANGVMTASRRSWRRGSATVWRTETWRTNGGDRSAPPLPRPNSLSLPPLLPSFSYPWCFIRCIIAKIYTHLLEDNWYG